MISPGLWEVLTRVRASSVGSVNFEAMNRATDMHRLRPVINRMLPFAEAREAYRHFEGRGHFGKVVLTHRSCA
jgi:NADPH:quinone reductase-like Zn-dependent oxidoreductase